MKNPIQGNRKKKKEISLWTKRLISEMKYSQRKRGRELSKRLRHQDDENIIDGNYYRKTRTRFFTAS